MLHNTIKKRQNPKAQNMTSLKRLKTDLASDELKFSKDRMLSITTDVSYTPMITHLSISFTISFISEGWVSGFGSSVELQRWENFPGPSETVRATWMPKNTKQLWASSLSWWKLKLHEMRLSWVVIERMDENENNVNHSLRLALSPPLNLIQNFGKAMETACFAITSKPLKNRIF